MRYFFPAATAITLTVIAAVSFARAAEIRIGDLSVTSAWARATPPGANTGAAYVTIENHGSESDRLISASSPSAGSVSIHETVEQNGVASMRPVETPAVPAGGTLAMAPGGMHLMLMGLTTSLAEGGTAQLTLVFETSGAVDLQIEIAPIGALGPAAANTAPHDHQM